MTIWEWVGSGYFWAYLIGIVLVIGLGWKWKI